MGSLIEGQQFVSALLPGSHLHPVGQVVDEGVHSPFTQVSPVPQATPHVLLAVEQGQVRTSGEWLAAVGKACRVPAKRIDLLEDQRRLWLTEQPCSPDGATVGIVGERVCGRVGQWESGD